MFLHITAAITNGRPAATDYHGDQRYNYLLLLKKILNTHCSRAIVNYAKEKQLISTETTTFIKAVPGHGIETTIDHHHILVGNRKLMADNDISLPKASLMI